MVNNHQVFLIFRHGARYSLDKPTHNILWPDDDNFWNSCIGKLTPVGVHQLTTLGNDFRESYPWVSTKNVKCKSTCKTRAIESAWSFLLGLLPDKSVHICQKREDDCILDENTCCINFYDNHESDKIFGCYESDLPSVNDNISKSYYLKDLKKNIKVKRLLKKLNISPKEIHKIKDIYSQLKIDQQFDDQPLVKHYKLTDTDIDLIEKIGVEVINRKSVPYTDDLNHSVFNKSQGEGILKYILKKIDNKGNNFHILSCHDSNIMAVMAVLGLKINTPDFGGYILIDRLGNNIDFYYCESPFGDGCDIYPRKWVPHNKRNTFLEYNSFKKGNFKYSEFKNIINTSLSHNK